MSIKLITPPAVEVFSLAEAKIALRKETDEEDALITMLISAARKQAEHITGRAFGAQTRELIIDAFPDDEILLPGSPVTSITSVIYADDTGATQTLDSAAYVLDPDYVPSSLLPAAGLSWPGTYDTANAVRVRYDCGHVAADVPDVKVWMQITVCTLFAQREGLSGNAISAVPRQAWDAYLDPYIIY
ncbi:MAG: head-tail connector protein [Anaerolineae bacterium]|nr:head-tail connector protein [Anaerolineae bacterium]